MAIIISLIMSFGLFTDNVHATYNSTDAPDSKQQQADHSTYRWDWDDNN